MGRLVPCAAKRSDGHTTTATNKQHLCCTHNMAVRSLCIVRRHVDEPLDVVWVVSHLEREVLCELERSVEGRKGWDRQLGRHWGHFLHGELV